GMPYPLTSESLKNARIRVIASPEQFAPRIASLRFLLPAEIGFEIYRGFGENELRENGIWTKARDVAQSAGWSWDHISLWDYPIEQQRQLELALATASPEQPSPIVRMFGIFKAPYKYMVEMTPEGQTVHIAPSDTTLRYVRTKQLIGQHGDALKDYLPIRTASQSYVNNPIMENTVAANYAAVWSGLCQLETGRPSSAVRTLERFLASAPSQGGRAGVQALIQSYIRQQNYSRAVSIVDTLPDQLKSRRDRWYAERWRKLIPEQSPSKELEKEHSDKTTNENPTKPAAEDPPLPDDSAPTETSGVPE
ncbi:MAG: hypothetical protein KDA80_15345, partial [Planctomycetaceae bacterium]|nr:hypothetical protein [Planctomycetaceae bacterium]